MPEAHTVLGLRDNSDVEIEVDLIIWNSIYVK